LSLTICVKPKGGTDEYENSFIGLISPVEFFGNPNIAADLAAKGLKLAQAEGREVMDLTIHQTRPLSVVMAEKVQETRDWASTRTVPCD
jgi:hypothetical protein